jgi:WhiB family redox-sensing transcriptional regulator
MTDYFDTALSACRDYPTDWWYPLKGRHAYSSSRDAVVICRKCPVRNPCLQYALVHETHGIWGGMREGEREIERRRRGIRLSEHAINTMSQQTVRMSRRLNNIDKEDELYL